MSKLYIEENKTPGSSSFQANCDKATAAIEWQCTKSMRNKFSESSHAICHVSQEDLNKIKDVYLSPDKFQNDSFFCRFSRGGDLRKTHGRGETVKDPNGHSHYILNIFVHEYLDSEPKAVQAVCLLTTQDAKYILSCSDTSVEFSVENAQKNKHSSHENPEDYKWLNLLFNKPANSDTLVAWYILAQTYTLHTDEGEKTNLLNAKDAWKINPSTPTVAKERIKDDIDAWIKSRNLSLPEEVKNNTIKQLKAFAAIVYGKGKIISENNVRNVFNALQPLFFAGAEK